MIAALTFTLPLSAVAASTPPRVVISEVNWAGSSISNADEWLELQNLEGETIDLSGWSIAGAGASGAALTLPAGASIHSGETYLISNYDAAHSALAVEPDFVTTSVSLSNAALQLTLKTNEGLVADTVGDGKAPSAGSSQAPFASMVKTSDRWATATTSKNFDAGAQALGTPGVADIAVATPQVEAVPIVEVEAEPDLAPITSPSVDPIYETEAVDADPATTSIMEVVAEAVMGTSTGEPSTSEEVIQIDSVPEEEETTTTENDTPTNTPVPATYAVGDLLINEIMSNPASGEEWVEVYNPYDNVIPLDGWKLTEAGGTSVSLSGLIGEESFVIAEFKNKLNNDGDTVMLSDPNGVVIDEIQFGENGEAEAPGKGYSLARTQNGEFVVTITPTPLELNRIEEPAVEKKQEKVVEKEGEKENVEEKAGEGEKTCTASNTLAVIKLLPDPIGDEETDESITLENTGDDPVCLDGWTIGDASKTYKLAGTLSGHLRLELPRSATKIALNNTSSEEVLLTNPAGEVINKISYETAIENSVYTLLDGQWSWQAISARDEQTDVQCPDATAESDGSTEDSGGSTSRVSKTTSTKKTSEQTTVEGVVIATPGTFGEQIMYIDGLQLYQYTGDFPAVEVGDVVSVSGVPSTSHGEARLKVASADHVTIVGADTANPAAVSVNDTSGYVGRLVRVQGIVTRRSGDRMTLEQDGAAVTVIAKDGTDVSFSGLVLGTELAVTAVVSTYDGSIRLLPRSTEDITSVGEEITENTDTPTPSTKISTAGIGLVGATTTAVGARAWWWRRKKKQA